MRLTNVVEQLKAFLKTIWFGLNDSASCLQKMIFVCEGKHIPIIMLKANK
jgi:hypothetical protein